MTQFNRRRFLGLAGTGAASALLVACGNKPVSDDELHPTMIPNVEGAAPTVPPADRSATPAGGASPQASPAGQQEQGGGGEQPAGGGGEQGGGGGGTAELKAVGSIAFDKKELTMSPGDTLNFENTTALQHDVVIEELNDLELIPLTDGGQTASGTLPGDTKPGTYTFYCSVPGHRAAGMEGTLTVK